MYIPTLKRGIFFYDHNHSNKGIYRDMFHSNISDRYDPMSDREAWTLFLYSLVVIRTNNIARKYCLHFTLLWSVVFTHVVIWLGNLVAGVILVVYAPWYICFPLITILMNPYVGGPYCFLVAIENILRLKLDIIQIPDFHFTRMLKFLFIGGQV